MRKLENSFTLTMKINTNYSSEHEMKICLVNKVNFLKYLIQQVTFFTIYIISASPLEAQENINFIGIKKPVREFNSLREEPLQWSMQRKNKSSITTKIVWSAPIFSDKDTDDSEKYHRLKWKILPYSEIELNNNMRLHVFWLR